MNVLEGVPEKTSASRQRQLDNANIQYCSSTQCNSFLSELLLVILQYFITAGHQLKSNHYCCVSCDGVQRNYFLPVFYPLASSRTPCSQWARFVQICWRLFPSPISQWESLKIETQRYTRPQRCHASIHGDNAWLERYVTLGWNIMSRLLVLSIPVMNCSRVSLPSRSWSMRRKMSRTRDLLSRSHLLNCEVETE